ncbi:unnamed protein product [Diamesa serratosioi]
MLLRKSLDVSQTKAATDGTWKCPNITDQRTLECGCDIPLTLRCSGDVHGLALIAEGLRRSSSSVSLLDCTLKNVTVLSEAKIFENVSLHGLFISSGEIKRVHRLAFVGLKTPLQILGLPNNALVDVPSNSLLQLKQLDRLDLSNNRIKELSSTDFMSLQKLTFLELSENQISSISPKTFNPLKSLVTLKLNGNRLGDSTGSLLNIVECTNLSDVSSLELDNDHIMKQINAMFTEINDNFTITNSSNNIKFVDYNNTASSLHLNWMLHLNKSIDFHSLIIFEESSIRVKLEKTGVTYRSIVRNHDEYFLVTVPHNVYENTGNSYEFCLIFSETQHQFFVGCSSNFVLLSNKIFSTESIVYKSDISTFDAVVERSDESLLMDDDLDEETNRMYPSSSPIIKTVKKSNTIDEDDSIEVYPSTDYYNTLWPNVSLSILIICMSLSIIYILYTKYRHYYKIHRVINQECISPSYSDDSINTQDEDENENTTNKYVKLQATTTL